MVTPAYIRKAESRAALATRGGKEISVALEKDALAQLRAIMNATGENSTDVINRLLRAARAPK